MIRRLLPCVTGLALLLGPWLALEARADCIVGDPSGSPAVSILTSPPDCCYGGWAGTIGGTVDNVDVDLIQVVLYAQTNLYWVQPYADQPSTIPSCDGSWSNSTHGGHQYCAILCSRSWAPPPTLGYLPPVGGDILAITCVPNGVRTVEFAGYTWDVKSNGDIRVDPGPNYFSDSAENVWVDDQGRLHLRLTQRGGNWYCPEVFSDRYFDYGRFEFTVIGPIDLLDPQVVAAGFLYADPDHEIDIEFSRWSVPADSNGQYVVQPWTIPGNRHRFLFTLGGATSSHEIRWCPDAVAFTSREGEMGEGGSLIQAWPHPGSPAAGAMRMRFNLWLIGGIAPTDGQEVELIITDFRYEDDCDTPVERTTWGRIKKAFQ